MSNIYKQNILKLFVLLLLMGGFTVSAKAEGYGWTKTMGGSSLEEGYDISIDSAGNIYITGHFSGTSDFNPDAVVADSHTSAGSTDIFITRINADGSYGWTKTIGGARRDFGLGISIDSADNIYITGSFEGTVDFNPDVIAVDSHTSAGSFDTFITRINADGSYGWTKTMGAGSSDYVQAISIDSADNIYITGYFYGISDFNPDAVTVDNHTSAGLLDIFITRINADGSYGWTRTMGGASNDYSSAISINSAGHVYITGHFEGTSDFNPDAVAVDRHTSAGSTDIFITRINADGSYGWTRTMGGASNDYSSAISINSAGHVYITGSFSGTSDFNPDVIAVDSHISVGLFDTFITRINADGSYGWTKTIGASTLGISIDSADNIYITGYFGGTADFNPDVIAVDSHTSAGSFDTFIMRINVDGSYGWTRTMGGGSRGMGRAISIGSAGHAYITGSFSGTSDFNPDAVAVDSHTSAGSTDIFITKLIGVVRPILSEVTAVTSPSSTGVPVYIYFASDAGSLTYSGSCSSTVVNAEYGVNSISFNALPDGTYNNCTITVTNAAGKASIPLLVSPFTIDTVAPPAAVLTSPAQNIVSNSVIRPMIAGTAEAGSSVNIKDAGKSLGLVTATGGTWSLTGGTVLSEGTHSFTARATDAAGNTGLPSTVTTYTVDTATTPMSSDAGCLTSTQYHINLLPMLAIILLGMSMIRNKKWSVSDLNLPLT